MQDNKLSMAFNDLLDGNIEAIPDNLVFILHKWLSYDRTNFKLCYLTNKYILNLPPEQVKIYLHLFANKNKRFIKMMRTSKDNTTELEFLRKYLKQYYNWTERELDSVWDIIQQKMEDPVVKEEMRRMFGFDKKECEALGIEYQTIKIRKENKPQKEEKLGESLLNF